MQERRCVFMNTNRALALGVYLAAPYVLCLLLSQQQFRIWTILLFIEAIAEVMVLLRPALCLSLAEAAAVQKDIKERKGVPAGGWDAFRVLCAACPPSWGGPQVQGDTHHLQNLAMMCVSCSRPAPGCVAAGKEPADAWIWPQQGLTAVPWAVQMLLLCPIPILLYKIP